MAFIDGDDPINGSLFSFQEWERMKNHWRGAAAPANIQPGMIFQRSTDDRLYAAGAASVLENILQVTRTNTLALTIQFKALGLKELNAICLDNSPVCINNEMIFLATW